MIQNENNPNENEEDLSIKSIDDEKENNNYIIDIIESSNKNIVVFKSQNNYLKINNKSIKKIFSLISEKEKLSDMYLDHITINIFDFNLNNNNELEDKKEKNKNMQNDDIDNDIELDIKYQTLLEKTSIFHINLENNLIKNNIEPNKIKSNENSKTTIDKKSLKKIFSYLNKSLIDMSDYINLIILYLQEENQNDFAKLLIQQKILGKYSGEPRNVIFDGKKDYNCNIDIPLKNESQNIYTFDNLFNKVLDYIDDYDKESSFSDNINNLIIPRKNIDDDLIQTTKVYFVEEGVLTDINSNKKIIKKKEINNNNENNYNPNICNNEFCNGICKIF